MAEETSTEPKLIEAETRNAGIAAWHDAVTPEQFKAAVREYPFLKDVYSEAKNFS